MQVAHENTAAPVRYRRPLPGLLSCIRFDEILILQGSPLLGALFSIDGLNLANAEALGLLTAGSMCLVAHVFLLNDWSGMTADLRDPNRTNAVFINRGVARSMVGYLWIAMLALSLLLLGALSGWTLIIAVALAGISALYSAPGAHIKGIPILSSLLHFAGGLLHFLLGYSVFRVPDGRGLEIGCFFALVFTAGHLNHETRDSESDRLNGIVTNAVRFGNQRNFITGLILFTMADIFLVALALRHIVPISAVVLIALYFLHVYWSWKTLRAGLSFNSIRRLQLRYRLRYAVIGLMMVWASIGAR